MPQQAFEDSFQIYFNNEELDLGYILPAHTDTDIYIRFQNANVLQESYLVGNSTEVMNVRPSRLVAI